MSHDDARLHRLPPALLPLLVALLVGCGDERGRPSGDAGIDTGMADGSPAAADDAWAADGGPAADLQAADGDGSPEPDSALAVDSGPTADAPSVDTVAPAADSGWPTDSGAIVDLLAADSAITGADAAVTPTVLYPAQPPAGTIYWGAALTGNGDPTVRHEHPTGHPLVLRRTFFQWKHRTGYLITTAKDDLAHGRLPWVSIKPPSWAGMAAGLHDAEIDAMIKALAALNGPVWLTVHHEPEGGGGVNVPDDPAGPAGHLAMNKRVRQRMAALKTTNITLLPILMTWSWDPASGRDPEQWWAPGVYDLLGVDHYRDAPQTLLTARWYKVRAWAAAKGVELAVGEWGMRGTDAAAGQRVKDWYEDAVGSHTDGKGARVVALSAYDSVLNAPTGPWELQGAQLTMFHQLLVDPRTADWPSLP